MKRTSILLMTFAASTLGSKSPSRAWGFYFHQVRQGIDCENERSHGQSIRPVRSAQ